MPAGDRFLLGGPTAAKEETPEKVSIRCRGDRVRGWDAGRFGDQRTNAEQPAIRSKQHGLQGRQFRQGPKRALLAEPERIIAALAVWRPVNPPGGERASWSSSRARNSSTGLRGTSLPEESTPAPCSSDFTIITYGVRFSVQTTAESGVAGYAEAGNDLWFGVSCRPARPSRSSNASMPRSAKHSSRPSSPGAAHSGLRCLDARFGGVRHLHACSPVVIVSSTA
jgi:hypothetical protein